MWVIIKTIIYFHGYTNSEKMFTHITNLPSCVDNIILSLCSLEDLFGWGVLTPDYLSKRVRCRYPGEDAMCAVLVGDEVQVKLYMEVGIWACCSQLVKTIALSRVLQSLSSWAILGLLRREVCTTAYPEVVELLLTSLAQDDMKSVPDILWDCIHIYTDYGCNPNSTRLRIIGIILAYPSFVVTEKLLYQCILYDNPTLTKMVARHANITADLVLRVIRKWKYAVPILLDAAQELPGDHLILATLHTDMLKTVISHPHVVIPSDVSIYFTPQVVNNFSVLKCLLEEDRFTDNLSNQELFALANIIGWDSKGGNLIKRVLHPRRKCSLFGWTMV